MHHKQDKEKKITCPVQILWGKKGTIEKLYNPIRIQKKWASDVTGYSINCGHFLPEEKPKEVMVAIQKFFMN